LCRRAAVFSVLSRFKFAIVLGVFDIVERVDIHLFFQEMGKKRAEERVEKEEVFVIEKILGRGRYEVLKKRGLVHFEGARASDLCYLVSSSFLLDQRERTLGEMRVERLKRRVFR
jgi:hypothetical protein